MARPAAVAMFALAALSAFGLSTGVATPPHRVAPGTPLNHDLPLSAYRFAFLIEPLAEEPVAMSPEMAALHKALALAGIPMTDMPGMQRSDRPDTTPIFATSGLHPAQDLAFAIALLVIAWPRLPRPTRRVLARLLSAPLPTPQWHEVVFVTPPRLAVLRVP